MTAAAAATSDDEHGMETDSSDHNPTETNVGDTKFNFEFNLHEFITKFDLPDSPGYDDLSGRKITLHEKIKSMGEFVTTFAPKFPQACRCQYHLEFLVYLLARFCNLHPGKGPGIGKKILDTDQKLQNLPAGSKKMLLFAPTSFFYYAST